MPLSLLIVLNILGSVSDAKVFVSCTTTIPFGKSDMEKVLVALEKTLCVCDRLRKVSADT